MEEFKLTIGEFSKLVNIPVSTLRYYDKTDVLVPETKDQYSNYRYYSEKQIMVAIYIKHLKSLGIDSMKEIKSLLARDKLRDVLASLDERLQQYKNEIQKLEFQYQYVEHIYKSFESVIPFTNEVLPKGIQTGISGLHYYPKRPIIEKEMTTHFYSSKQFYTAYTVLAQQCDENKVRHDGILSMIFLDHHPGRFDGRQYKGILFLSVDEPDNNGFGYREYGDFWVYSAIHTGHYKELPALYESLTQQINVNHLKIIGDPFEEYLLYYSLTLNENHFITRLSFPVSLPA